MKGIVIKSTGSWYTVRKENGEHLEARIKGKFRIQGIKTTNPLAVGDVVELEMENDGTAIVTNIEPRKNYIIRKSVNLSKRAHIIAANVDQAVLIVTLSQPKTFTAFIDRFLVSAEAYHIPTVIVFNKIDVYNDDELKELAALKEVYSKIGYKCLETSATKNKNIDLFKEVLKNKTSVISGHSGVGKSTLLNTIEPSLNLKTSTITSSHQVGKHTTTFAEMFELSLGGFIIDTPGIKAFGLIDFDKNELSHYFIEMRERLSDCQFNNCVHVNEPKCAVKKAFVNEEIAEFRYVNYLSMFEEDEDETYRSKGY